MWQRVGQARVKLWWWDEGRNEATSTINAVDDAFKLRSNAA
jgi:hypothetical protein